MRAAISSASSICFLYDFSLPCSWSIRVCILSWFFLSSSPAKISSLIPLSDFLKFLETSAKRLPSASSSDSSSLILVSILIMAFLPPEHWTRLHQPCWQHPCIEPRAIFYPFRYPWRGPVQIQVHQQVWQRQ